MPRAEASQLVEYPVQTAGNERIANRTTFLSRGPAATPGFRSGFPWPDSMQVCRSGLEVFYTLQEPFHSQAMFPIGQLLLYGLPGDSVEQDIGGRRWTVPRGATTFRIVVGVHWADEPIVWGSA
jgi:hypothetical protein